MSPHGSNSKAVWRAVNAWEHAVAAGHNLKFTGGIVPRLLGLLLFIAGSTGGLVLVAAQQDFSPSNLDLTGDIRSPLLESSLHQPLPEQYVWLPVVKDGSRDNTFYFHDSFNLKSVPGMATLYIAGPEHLRVYLNGRLLANAERDQRLRLRPMVLVLPVAENLLMGENTMAIEASHGDRLAVKIVPRAPGLDAPALTMSDGGWKCSDHAEVGWERPGYRADSWSSVRSLGGIESNIDSLRWNSDAGMYQWAGYDGISPFLAHLPVPVDRVVHSFEGLGKLFNLSVIAPVDPDGAGVEAAQKSKGEFTVTLPPASASREEYPYILVDLGRESDGRIEIVSDSDTPARVELQYGESRDEAIHEPYLGATPLVIPPHSRAYGPKSALRYALIRFLAGNSPQIFKSIRFDSIYYPVKYQGSFESSDVLLNRIWQVGAYTAHLSMQDEIWDAPKRDRAPYAGDLNVSGRVIDTVFADKPLMQRTIDDLMPDAEHHVTGDVNGIPGYSAFWIMDLADHYRHTGDRAYLQSHVRLLTELLAYMQTEFDSRSLYIVPNPRVVFLFVDWSPDLNGDTPELRRASTLEFAKGFAEGAWLLGEAGDSAGAAKYITEADGIRQAAQMYLVDPATGTFGTRWQSNAMAIFSGVATEQQAAAIWEKVLSHPRQFMISPYYSFYVISAMAASGHRKEALDWIREYWGGMVKEGATTFWEGYDPDWPKEHFHEMLQADNTQGFIVSLCHGWSSGPTAWLMEQVLGIEPHGAGFSKVSIRPDLVGLDWARGTEPTPVGPIKVNLHRIGAGLEAELSLPPGVDAEVSMPASRGATEVKVNGQEVPGISAENGTRLLIRLNTSGIYKLSTAPISK